jgi:glycosyltransferase involved in cell wall biosynthesis
VSGDGQPLFSVVIPTRDRRAALEVALAAWELQQPAELPFELVVVDDGSRDGTLELLAALRPHRFRLRFVGQQGAGPAAARNRAVRLALGDLVLFTGDDIEPTPTLLDQHWRGHCAREALGTAVLGLTRWPDQDGLTSTMRHIDGPGAQQFSYGFFVDGAEYDFRHLYTSNVSLRRALLDLEPDGFSTDFPAAAFEDAELGYRLSRHGLHIFYRASAVAFHHHHYSARGFFERQKRCGRMAAILVAKHPQLERWVSRRELEWLRLEMLRMTTERRRLVEAVARRLERWQERVVALAEAYDRPLRPEVDRLLLPLFRYAYLRGLVQALYDDEEAAEISAELYLRLLPQAVRQLGAELAHHGIPLPQADFEAVTGLSA